MTTSLTDQWSVTTTEQRLFMNFPAQKCEVQYTKPRALFPSLVTLIGSTSFSILHHFSVIFYIFNRFVTFSECVCWCC